MLFHGGFDAVGALVGFVWMLPDGSRVDLMILLQSLYTQSYVAARCLLAHASGHTLVKACCSLIIQSSE